MAKASQTRERILTAAEDVVLREGVAHLTLDSAAAEAGLSKGGVLYHFPGREALVAAMVQRLVGGFEASMVEAEAAAETGAGAGTWTRAYVQDTFCEQEDSDLERRQARLGAALIAAIASEPALLTPLRESARRWQAQVENDGLDPVLATIVRLAADGLWLNELFGMAWVRPDLRAQVRDRLSALATPDNPTLEDS